jgi:hypothetical protein
MMVSADVMSLEGIVGGSRRYASAPSVPCLELLHAVLCLIVLHATLRIGLSSSCWCCRSRLLVCSGCFAAIITSVSPLRQILCCCECDAPISGCFAALMVVVSSECFAAMLQFWWMLCCRDLLSSGCFAAVVVLAPLADALPPRLFTAWRMLCRCGLFYSGCFTAVVILVPLADALPPRWLVAFAVSLHYWLPMYCIHVLG